METCLNYTDGTAYFSSDERKWISKVRKLKAEHPEEVQIIREPETNDGCIYARFPASWLKIRPKQVLSEEEFARRSELAKKMNAQNFLNSVNSREN